MTRGSRVRSGAPGPSVVLVTDPRPDILARAVEDAASASIPWADPEGGDLAGVEVWFCAGSPPGRFLDLPSLRWIHSGWAGVETWFQRPEWKEGVILTRTVGDYPRRMAEHVFGYLLAQELGVARAVHQMRARTWRRWTPGTLAGKSLLVVGYGAIGRDVARFARALDMPVEAIRRGPVTAEERVQGVHDPGELDACLARADVVVNLLPLTRATDTLWTRRRFERMREGSVFVNLSRGATVDEGALLEGIQRGRPGRAILDVFREEPLPPNHPLRGFDEIWITPHIAGVGTVRALAADFAENWRRYRAGEPLRNVVERERGY